MLRPLRILYVEDEPHDVELAMAALTDAGFTADGPRVDTRDAFVAALEAERWDLILSDYALPGFDGLTALRETRARDHTMPFVLVSGTVGEEVAIESLKAGATDYVLKTRLSRLGHVVARALREVGMRRTADEAASALERSEARFRTLFERATVGLAIADVHGRIVTGNRHLGQLLGVPADALSGYAVSYFLNRDDVPAWNDALATVASRGAPQVTVELQLVLADGATVWAEVTASIADESDPDELRLLLVARDVGERRRTEERLRRIVEAIPNAIVVVNAEGRVVLVNSETERLLGYSRNELIGSAVEALVPDVIRPEHAAFRHGYMTAPDARPMGRGRDLHARRRDGTEVSVELGLSPISTDGGILVLAAMVDVTERRTYTEALRREAEVEGALAHAGRVLLAMTDTTATIQQLCELQRELLNADACNAWRPETEGTLTLVAHSGDLPPAEPVVIAADVRSVLDGVERHGVVALAPRGGAEAAVLERLGGAAATTACCVALRQAGTPAGLLVATRRRPSPFGPHDVRLAAGLGQLATIALVNAGSLEERERVARLKSEFVATISHELRTPLNPIVGYTEMLLDGGLGTLTPAQADVLRRIERNAGQLLELITSTLDLSRLEAGLMPLDVTEVDLAPMLRALPGDVPALAERREVRFRCEVAPGLPPIRTDVSKLRVVLRNLLSNAAKFTERGEIALLARPVAVGAEIVVRDTGRGIPDDALPWIFDSFRQVGAMPTRDYGGVGLGLYIVRRVLERLGGSVEVESRIGEGSSFRIWLPAEPSART